MSSYPQVLINFKVFNGDEDLLGAANLELPDIESMTASIGGSGIAGDIDVPVFGHTQSMQTKISFRTWSTRLTKLAIPNVRTLTARSSVQLHDVAAGELVPTAEKCVLQGLTRKLGLGKREAGKQMDNEYEMETIYLKLWFNNGEQIEIDKLNYIYKVNGTDYLQAVREHLGLET